MSYLAAFTHGAPADLARNLQSRSANYCSRDGALFWSTRSKPTRYVRERTVGERPRLCSYRKQQNKHRGHVLQIICNYAMSSGGGGEIILFNYWEQSRGSWSTRASVAGNACTHKKPAASGACEAAAHGVNQKFKMEQEQSPVWVGNRRRRSPLQSAGFFFSAWATYIFLSSLPCVRLVSRLGR